MKPVFGSFSQVLNGWKTFVFSHSPAFSIAVVTGFSFSWSQPPNFWMAPDSFSPIRSMNGFCGSPSLPPNRLTFRSRQVSDRPFFMLVQMPSLPTKVSFRGANASFKDVQICPSAPPSRFRIGLPSLSRPLNFFSPKRPFAIGSMMLDLIVSPRTGKMPRSL